MKLDEAGYIIAGEEGITETPGVFGGGRYPHKDAATGCDSGGGWRECGDFCT